MHWSACYEDNWRIGVSAKKRDGPLKIRAASATDVGRVRRTNEDSCLVSLTETLFIVSDGMGGHSGGEVASKAVVSVLPHLIKRRLGRNRGARTRDIEKALRDAVLDLSRQLRAQSTGKLGLQGMGATVAMTWLRGGVAYLVHMGDSRIYLLRGGKLAQLTEDHSVVALLLKHGDVTPEDAKVHPARGKLSRYVGMEGEVFPDVRSVRLQAGDRMLLCSDGLTGMVADKEIAQLLQDHDAPEAACRALVAAAIAAGGTDNITTITLNVEAQMDSRFGAKEYRISRT